MEEKENTNHVTIKKKKWLFNLLLLSCLCVFSGRAFQHFFQDIPLRTLLWDQSLMEPLVNFILNLRWEDYTSDRKWDKAIQMIIKLMGVVYLICAAVCVSIYFQSKKYAKLLIIGSFSLLMLSFIYFIDKFFRLGELFEYTAQWMSPVVLYMLVIKDVKIYALGFYMRVAVALTFAGHGLYAIGFYPIPGQFIDMIIMALHVDESTAVVLLQCAGWIDLAIALLILIPVVYRYAALYAFAWGVLTAIARVWSNYDATLPLGSLYQWFPETLVRFPNAIIPLAIYYTSIYLDKRLAICKALQ